MFTRPGRSHFFLLNSCEIQHFQLSQGLEIIFFRNPTEIHDSTRETIAAKIASRTNSLTCSGCWLSHPSEKYEFVNGKDDIPYMKWKIKIMFETTNQLFILIILFLLEKDHALFIPVIYFIVFSFLFFQVFPPFGIFIFPSFAFKIVLGSCQKKLFLKPFSFFFFRFCIVLVICPSFALKIAKRCQKKFFLEPFSFFRFGYFCFLCILN